MVQRHYVVSHMWGDVIIYRFSGLYYYPIV